MATRYPRILAWAQLVRLPNLFTAVADPLAGWFIIGAADPAWQLPALAGASACLYSSGIVFNDCFDYEADRRDRPERPLARGTITRPAAWTLAALLMILGLALTAAVSAVAAGIGLFLAGLILFYNGWSKRFAGLGPLTLGACRFANVLLGMRSMPPKLWVAPVVVGVYVTVLSVIARREELDPRLRLTVKRLLLGIIVLDALLVALSPAGDWVGAALVLSLLVPAVVLGRLLPMT